MRYIRENFHLAVFPINKNFPSDDPPLGKSWLRLNFSVFSITEIQLSPNSEFRIPNLRRRRTVPNSEFAPQGASAMIVVFVLSSAVRADCKGCAAHKSVLIVAAVAELKTVGKLNALIID